MTVAAAGHRADHQMEGINSFVPHIEPMLRGAFVVGLRQIPPVPAIRRNAEVRRVDPIAKLERVAACELRSRLVRAVVHPSG
jgi:hypothetical protein